MNYHRVPPPPPPTPVGPPSRAHLLTMQVTIASRTHLLTMHVGTEGTVPAMVLALLLALLHVHPGSSGLYGVYKAPIDSTSISPLGGTVWSNLGTLGVVTPVVGWNPTPVGSQVASCSTATSTIPKDAWMGIGGTQLCRKGTTITSCADGSNAEAELKTSCAGQDIISMSRGHGTPPHPLPRLPSPPFIGHPHRCPL